MQFQKGHTPESVNLEIKIFNVTTVAGVLELDIKSNSVCLFQFSAPRSGLAWKHSIDVGAGVVDFDYRGNVGVILFNFSDIDFEVKVGDRVAQLILEKICTPDVVEVESLDETERGAGGYGSTGISGVVKKEKTNQ